MLTEAQVTHFHETGYLIVENVLDTDTLNTVEAEYDALIDQAAARMYAQGKISSSYKGLPFGERYTRILQEDSTIFDQLEICLTIADNRVPDDATIHTGPAVFKMLTHPKILDVVESIIGPEITVSPRHHIRLKPPRKQIPQDSAGNSYIAHTPWHQDHAFVTDEAQVSQDLTVWVAMTDATPENGCLLCIPGSHKKEGDVLNPHCPGSRLTSEYYIPGALLETRQAVPLPVKRGGVVLFHRYNAHASYQNKSNGLRWSFDLRYLPTGQPNGRPFFPEFVARSAAHPETVLSDPNRWARLWQKAHERLSGGINVGPIYPNKWLENQNLPICA